MSEEEQLAERTLAQNCALRLVAVFSERMFSLGPAWAGESTRVYRCSWYPGNHIRGGNDECVTVPDPQIECVHRHFGCSISF